MVNGFQRLCHIFLIYLDLRFTKIYNIDIITLDSNLFDYIKIIFFFLKF